MTPHHAGGGKQPLTFSKFIMSRHATDTPRGDFIKDTRMLIKRGKFPTIHKRSELDHFLWRRGACPETVLQGRKMWGEYRRARDKKFRRPCSTEPTSSPKKDPLPQLNPS